MVRGHGKAGWSHLFAGLIALGLGVAQISFRLSWLA